MRSSNPSSDDSTTPDRDVSAVVCCLQALGRALQAARLYDPEHPLVLRQTRDAVEALRGLDPGDALTLGVGVGCLYVGETELNEPEEVRGLSEAWHTLDLGLVQVRHDVTPEQLGEAVALWASALQHKTVDTPALVETVSARTRDAVSCVPLDYERIRVQDSAREQVWSWSNMIDALITPSTEPGAEAQAGDTHEDAERVAAWVGHEARRDADGAMRLLHDRMHRTVRQAAANDGAPDTAALQRVRRFLESLTPELRAALLEAAPAGVADAVPAAEAPCEVVLSALAQLDGQLSRATRQSLLMCAKLASLGAGLERDDTGEDGASIPSSDLVNRSLQELLTQHDPAEYTPPDYLRRLEAIATGSVSGGHAGGDERYAEAFSATQVRLHATQIAVHLTSSYTDDDGPCHEPMVYLLRVADALVAEGSCASVAAAARAAENRLTRGGPDELLRTAREFLDRVGTALHEPGVLERLLQGETDPTDLSTLLRLSPPEGLVSVVSRLVEHDNDGPWPALTDALRGAGTTALEPAVAHLRETDPARLPRLVSRLGGLPFKVATRWLGGQLTQPDIQGRADAFAALFRGCPVWPAAAAEALLNHPDAAVRRLSVERLLEQDDDVSQLVLGRILSGQFEGGIPTLDEIDRVVRVLLQRGEAGVHALVDALKHLGGVFSPRRSRTAAHIANHMAQATDNPAAIEATRAWFRSASAIWARSSHKSPPRSGGRAA